MIALLVKQYGQRVTSTGETYIDSSDSQSQVDLTQEVNTTFSWFDLSGYLEVGHNKGLCLGY